MRPQRTLCRLIPLSRGLYALVDDVDYERLNVFNWCASKADGTFYAVRSAGKRPHRRSEYMHRVILGVPDGLEADHINGDSLDNRRCNLRLATRQQNGRNRRAQSNNASGYSGVFLNRVSNKWQAYIVVDRHTRYLKRFDTPEEAARAYDGAARQLFGEFARLNFPAG